MLSENQPDKQKFYEKKKTFSDLVTPFILSKFR